MHALDTTTPIGSVIKHKSLRRATIVGLTHTGWVDTTLRPINPIEFNEWEVVADQKPAPGFPYHILYPHECPYCKASLKAENSLRVTLLVPGQEIECDSKLDDVGALVEPLDAGDFKTPLADGYHCTTRCAVCDEDLANAELERPYTGESRVFS